ncbi:MAG: hypothetical protein DRO98_06190 [Archaeoglobales archaeon]|nr:MAG: hypothetical protein DRO98_06190 [Archaeoglobales archaeon]
MIIIGFAWLMVNVPQLFALSVIYSFLCVFIGVVGLAERIAPKKSDVAILIWGYGKWGEQLAVGVAVAVPFVLMSFIGAYQLAYSYQFLSLKGRPLAAVIVTAFLIPIAEEGFFRCVIAPTTAEGIGVVPAALVSASTFAIFHFAVYQASIPAMFLAFLFGAFAAFADLIYKSGLPGLVGHIIINYSATLSVLPMLCVPG